MADSFLSVTRHPDYYISGADLSFQVEHIQFRVHRYFFERESPFFRARLATPASPGSQPQGAVDSNAIILKDATPEDFAIFLWVFYNPRYSLYDAPAESWSVILQLANKWEFPEVKSLAIRELEEKVMPDVTRVKLYHDNNVDKNFLIPRYAALCEREEPLTFQEGMDLGIQTALMIAAGRERVREAQIPGGGRSPLTPTIRGPDSFGVIRQLFDIEAIDTSSSSTNTDVPPNQPGGLSTPPAQQGTNHPEGKVTPTTSQKAKGAKDQNQTTSSDTVGGTPQPPLVLAALSNKVPKQPKKTLDDKPSVTMKAPEKDAADTLKTTTSTTSTTNENAINSPPITLFAIPSPLGDENTSTPPISIFGPDFSGWS